jgi:hypothetical protein
MMRIAIVAMFAFAAASASAKDCRPTDDEVVAQTAKCLLSIDGKLLVNERCNVLFTPNGREVDLDAGKYYAVVSTTLDRKGEPTVVTASWNRGSGRSDHLTSLGVSPGSSGVQQPVGATPASRCALPTTSRATARAPTNITIVNVRVTDAEEILARHLFIGNQLDRQLCDIRSNPSRLIFAEQLRC